MTPASDHPPARPDVLANTDVADGEDTAVPPDDRQLNMAAGFEVRLQRGPIEIQAELEPIMRNPKVGAVVNFVGVVRQSGDLDDVVALDLEHYPGMTEKALANIVSAAMQRWELIDALVIHRVGKLKPEDQIVLVAVASKHRGESFAACEFIMDYLKSEAPFWKKEQTPEGARWVDARVTDDKALARWGITTSNAASVSSQPNDYE